MSESTATEDKQAVSVATKPPLPRAPSTDAGSVKSDSFRHVDYAPPEGSAASKSEETLLGSLIRRISGRGSLNEGSSKKAAGQQSGVKAPLDSDAVIQELDRRASQDLPPLPPSQPTPPRTSSGTIVGLQTVTLVPLDQPPVEQTASDPSAGKKPLEKDADGQQAVVVGGGSHPAEKEESNEIKEASAAPASAKETSQKVEGDGKTTKVAVSAEDSEAAEVVRIDGSKTESGVAKSEDRDKETVVVQTKEQTGVTKEGAVMSKAAVDSKSEEAAAAVAGEGTHARDTVTVAPAEKDLQSEQTPVAEEQLVNPEAALVKGEKGAEGSTTVASGEKTSETTAVAAAGESKVGEGAATTKEDDKKTTSQGLESTNEEQAAPTLGTTRVPGVGGSMKVPDGHEPERVLPHSATTVGTDGGSRPGFFKRLFSFGSRPSGKLDEVPQEDEEKDTAVVEGADSNPIKKEESEKVESAPMTTPVEEPSASRKSPTPETEQTEVETAAVETPPDNTPQDFPSQHNRASSELTSDELNSLKTLFMDEMKNKGIHVREKYTKSSADFDSPLMFLLDLHTFAETQQSSIRLKHVLEDRYGAETSIVTEFNEATAAQELKTPPHVETKAKQGETDETKGDSSSADNYESGLDTAKDSAHNEKSAPPLAAESSSEGHTALTKQTEDVTTPKLEDSGSKEPEELKKPSSSSSSPSTPSTVESKASGSDKPADDQAPPEIPRHRDESKNISMRGCFWCYACMTPSKAQ